MSQDFSSDEELNKTGGIVRMVFHKKKRIVFTGLTVLASLGGLLLFQNFSFFSGAPEGSEIMQYSNMLYENLKMSESQLLEVNRLSCAMQRIDTEYDNLDARYKLLKTQVAVPGKVVPPAIFSSMQKAEIRLSDLASVKSQTQRLNYVILDLTSTDPIPLTPPDLSKINVVNVKVLGPVYSATSSVPGPVEMGLLVIDNTPYPRGIFQIQLSEDSTRLPVKIVNAFVLSKSNSPIDVMGPMLNGVNRIDGNLVGFRSKITSYSIGSSILTAIAGRMDSYKSGGRPCMPAALRSISPIKSAGSYTIYAPTSYAVNNLLRCEANRGEFVSSASSIGACQAYGQRLARLLQVSDPWGGNSQPLPDVGLIYQGMPIPTYPNIACTATLSGLQVGMTQPPASMIPSNRVNQCLMVANQYAFNPPPVVAEKLVFGNALLLVKNVCTLFDMNGTVLSRSNVTTEQGCYLFDRAYTQPTYFTSPSAPAAQVFFGFKRLR